MSEGPGSRPGAPLPPRRPAEVGGYGAARASGDAGAAARQVRNPQAGSAPGQPAYEVDRSAPRMTATPVSGPRRARLSLRTIDPWSVFRFMLVFSVSLLIVWLVVAAVLFSLLQGMGVLDSFTSLINKVLPSATDRTTGEIFSFSRVMAWAAGLGVINAILFTALGTLGSFVYNLCSRIVGGIDVTLADRD